MPYFFPLFWILPNFVHPRANWPPGVAFCQNIFPWCNRTKEADKKTQKKSFRSYGNTVQRKNRDGQKGRVSATSHSLQRRRKPYIQTKTKTQPNIPRHIHTERNSSLSVLSEPQMLFRNLNFMKCGTFSFRYI